MGYAGLRKRYNEYFRHNPTGTAAALLNDTMKMLDSARGIIDHLSAQLGEQGDLIKRMEEKNADTNAKCKEATIAREKAEESAQTHKDAFDGVTRTAISLEKERDSLREKLERLDEDYSALHSSYLGMEDKLNRTRNMAHSLTAQAIDLA